MNKFILTMCCFVGFSKAARLCLNDFNTSFIQELRDSEAITINQMKNLIYNKDAQDTISNYFNNEFIERLKNLPESEECLSFIENNKENGFEVSDFLFGNVEIDDYSNVPVALISHISDEIMNVFENESILVLKIELLCSFISRINFFDRKNIIADSDSIIHNPFFKKERVLLQICVLFQLRNINIITKSNMQELGECSLRSRFIINHDTKYEYNVCRDGMEIGARMNFKDYQQIEEFLGEPKTILLDELVAKFMNEYINLPNYKSLVEECKNSYNVKSFFMTSQIKVAAEILENKIKEFEASQNQS